MNQSPDADPQRELPELRHQRDAATAQTAALGEVLRAIAASPEDPQPVFELIARRARELCSANTVTVLEYDGTLMHIRAMVGHMPAAGEKVRQTYPRPFDPDNVVGRAILGSVAIHQRDERDLTDSQRSLGVRSALFVPLRGDARAVGVIGLGRGQTGGFSDSEIALVESFADQASLAIAGAARQRALQEALEQQTATAEILQVINASPGDLTPVFETILVKAHALCGAELGSLGVFDGQFFRKVARYGYQGQADEFLSKPYPPSQNHAPLFQGEIVHIPDVMNHPWGERTATAHAFFGSSGLRTWLEVPLWKDGTLLGTISGYRREPRPFTDTEIKLLRSFAAQAVIAMENARLLGELRERTAELAERNDAFAERIEHQAATIDVLKEMSASPGDPQPVFDLIIRQARDLCSAPSAALFEYDGQLVHFRAYHGRRGRSVAELGASPEGAAYVAMFPMPPNAGSISCRAIIDKEIVHIRDKAVEPGVDPAVLGVGTGSQLSIPLLRDGAAIGSISIGAGTTGGFTDSQIELLKTFAEQAAIAIASAETYRALQTRTADLQESLEQQTATAEILGVINRSPGDLTPVFDAILEKAHTLLGASIGTLWTFDGAYFHGLATHGHPDDVADYIRRHPVPPSAGSQQMVDGERFNQIPDMRAIVPRPPGIISLLVERTDVRTYLGIPLRKDGRFIGMITAFRTEVRPFVEKEIALLESFAAQAVIAMENARLLGELRERTAELAERNTAFAERIDHQAATIDVLKEMSASPADPQPVFELIATQAKALLGVPVVTIFEYDGHSVHIRCSAGAIASDPVALEAYYSTWPRVPDRGSLTCRAILDGTVVHIRNLDEEDGISQAVRDLGHKTQISIPFVRDGRSIGAITTGSLRADGISDTQIELLKTFAEQAVIAISSAETYRALEERTAALAQRNSEFGERIEQQAATIDVLKVMSSTPDDVQPVFDLIVQRAQELCDARLAVLCEFDGELVHFRSVHFDKAAGLTETVDHWRRTFPMVPTRASFMCRTILDQQIIRFGEIKSVSGVTRFVRDLGMNGGIALPLIRDGKVLGSFGLTSRVPGGLTDSQVALLQTFAEQAVIAIGSVATFKALRERTAELTRSVSELQTLEEVLRAVNSSLDLDTVLETIISRAVRLSRADEGMIYEFDEAEGYFIPKSAYGMTTDRIAGLRQRRIRIGETYLGRSALERAPVHVDDVQQDASLSDTGGLLAGIHAVLAVPLLKEDKVVGGLVIRRRTEGGFDSSTVTLMQTFAGQCVLAIENARLFQQLGERGEEARRARLAAETALNDLQKAQDRLVQTEKLASLGQLTAGIAHEIKNPLNFVNNFSELSTELLDELLDTVAPGKLEMAASLRGEIDDITTTLKSNLEKIVHHGKRADSIVKNMLLHSRTGPSEHRPIDVNNTVEEALNLAYHGARAENQQFNITMEKDLDPNAGTIDAYPQEFVRVMLNLIGNGFYAAIKRAHETAGLEPVLKVTTQDRGEWVDIRVRDNGTGIPSDEREKIFEPFFTTKPAGQGTGLGLSLSHDIVVKQHGGQIGVDSEAGSFTEFTVTLPRRMARGDGA